MQSLKEKPLREEILKLEVDLRRVKDPEKFLQQLRETLTLFDIDKGNIEVISVFAEKKWHVPETTFISLSVSKDTCTKLSQWQGDKDNLIIEARHGELLILNETKLNTWRLDEKNRKQKHTTKREK